MGCYARKPILDLGHCSRFIPEKQEMLQKLRRSSSLKIQFFLEFGSFFANGLLKIPFFREFGSVFANGLLKIPFFREFGSVFANGLLKIKFIGE